ncbi:DUF4179 domain-containing protein [Paenibacillus rhizovicinus]|uniref:DUF4179 domain-containing protein n=1 Tax=Paenibacillus rhizovicinus TaxID=2704463 RepID=A0A6C0NY00_9BACL|nr:DUF4179 domain-containing protein [Paenibacillus rhizovicinus]QHW31078.1 DUF4179 domain-containing protein [Paenibacillus rhizovicinus]
MNNKRTGQPGSTEETAGQDWLEAELQRWGDEAGRLAVPAEAGQALRSGLDPSSASARIKRSSRRRRRSGYAAAVAMLLACILMTASVSPAFASALQHIPGMSRILSLIGSDPGLHDAIDHDYMQPVGLSDKHGGNEFTVEGIVVDQVRMNVFFTVKLAKPKDTVYFGDMKVRDGATMQEVAALSSYSMQAEQDGIYRGVIDLQMGDGEPVPDSLSISFSPDSNDQQLVVQFPVDKTKSAGMEEVLEVHQTVSVGGQKLTIERAHIYPTRLIVDISFDEANSKQIFELGDLSIVGEKGEVLQNKGAFLGDKEQTLQFDSSFFHTPKHLTLKVGRIMALDKDKRNLVIDLGAKKIVQAPDDQVGLTSVSRQPNGNYELQLSVQGPTIPTDHFGYTLGSELTDANGKAYQANLKRSGWGANEDKVTIDFKIPADQQLQNPVSLKIDNYPAWIDEPFEVKLK